MGKSDHIDACDIDVRKRPAHQTGGKQFQGPKLGHGSGISVTATHGLRKQLLKVKTAAELRCSGD